MTARYETGHYRSQRSVLNRLHSARAFHNEAARSAYIVATADFTLLRARLHFSPENFTANVHFVFNRVLILLETFDSIFFFERHDRSNLRPLVTWTLLRAVIFQEKEHSRCFHGPSKRDQLLLCYSQKVKYRFSALRSELGAISKAVD